MKTVAIVSATLVVGSLVFAAVCLRALYTCVRDRRKVEAERDAMIEQNKRLMELITKQNEALKLSREPKPEARPYRFPN